MKRHRIKLTIAVIAALLVLGAIAAFVFVPWPDANHKEAVQIAQNAGIPAGMPVGPQP